MRSGLVMLGWQPSIGRFLLEDTCGRRSFAFGKLEFTVLELLDGRRTLEDVARDASLAQDAT